MNLVCNDQSKLAHPGSLVPQERVRFLVGAEYDVVSSKPKIRAVIVARGYSGSDIVSVGFLDCRVSLEFLEFLASQGTKGGQVDCLAAMFENVLQNAELRD